MARRFEMREVGSRRLLGTIETPDDVAPTAIVGMFRGNLVQVDVAPAACGDTPAAATAHADHAAEERRPPPAPRRKVRA